jgi:hypothetical protein
MMSDNTVPGIDSVGSEVGVVAENSLHRIIGSFYVLRITALFFKHLYRAPRSRKLRCYMTRTIIDQDARGGSGQSRICDYLTVRGRRKAGKQTSAADNLVGDSNRRRICSA